MSEDKKKFTSKKNKKKELSASEALLTFAGWLTTNKSPVILGSKHDSAIVIDLIDKFCDAYKLSKPSSDWRENKGRHLPQYIINNGVEFKDA